MPISCLELASLLRNCSWKHWLQLLELGVKLKLMDNLQTLQAHQVDGGSHFLHWNLSANWHWLHSHLKAAVLISRHCHGLPATWQMCDSVLVELHAASPLGSQDVKDCFQGQETSWQVCKDTAGRISLTAGRRLAAQEHQALWPQLVWHVLRPFFLHEGGGWGTNQIVARDFEQLEVRRPFCVLEPFHQQLTMLISVQLILLICWDDFGQSLLVWRLQYEGTAPPRASGEIRTHSGLLHPQAASQPPLEPKQLQRG